MIRVASHIILAQVMLPLRLWLSAFGWPGIMPWGRWWCPILPRADRLHLVVGKPLLPPAPAPEPTNEQVREHHARYVAALTELYDRHKVQYYGAAAASAKLEIW